MAPTREDAVATLEYAILSGLVHNANLTNAAKLTYDTQNLLIQDIRDAILKPEVQWAIQMLLTEKEK